MLLPSPTRSHGTSAAGVGDLLAPEAEVLRATATPTARSSQLRALQQPLLSECKPPRSPTPRFGLIMLRSAALKLEISPFEPPELSI